ncbi:hypothetical protein [Sporisorium scitamineum]|uniref:Uncharacterized protein n=1 Tax=Sporisorium scitamineum TaxID=49012 RepID=A0A0F7RWZ3_9BASI|nr:hypothetical protein [Sporisorium scitamineum]
MGTYPSLVTVLGATHIQDHSSTSRNDPCTLQSHISDFPAWDSQVGLMT